MNTAAKTPGRNGIVAGIFHAGDRGDRALNDLKAAGFTQIEISKVDPGEEAARPAPGGASDVAPVSTPFFQEHDSSASAFFAELVRLGFSKHDGHDLVDALSNGDALVTTDAGSYLDRAVAIFEQNGGDVRYAIGNELASGTAAGTAAEGDRELQLRAERLIVNKQRVQHGEARIRKEIVTEMKSIDVPVSHEELVIERHAVSGAGTVDAEPIAGETIRIPLTEEMVTVTKQTVVKEEVEIGTRRVEEIEHVTDTVRHEELRIDEAAQPPDATQQTR